MKNMVIGFILGVLFSGAVAFAATDINVEALWNLVFDSTTNTIRVVGK